MGVSSAVQWWEDWQLDVLVVASQGVQCLLLFAAPLRKFAIPSLVRFLIWLAYLGSDALAIYALATLFNRHMKLAHDSALYGSYFIEVVWAPILLMHLGGQDGITAYNIEDNELWRRQVVTSLSQITVTFYVVYKWSGSQHALMPIVMWLSFPGILKCLEKPWALKCASINSLVSSKDDIQTDYQKAQSMISSLPEFVEAARVWFKAEHKQQSNEDVDPEADHRQTSTASISRKEDEVLKRTKIREEKKKMDRQARMLFLDMASPYDDRFDNLKSFSVIEKTEAYPLLKKKISDTFDLLYTKAKMNIMKGILSCKYKLVVLSSFVRGIAAAMTLTSIAFFHGVWKDGYDDTDLSVTYALLSCSAMLELVSLAKSYTYKEGLTLPFQLELSNLLGELRLARMIKSTLCMMVEVMGLSRSVAQYNLLGFYVRKKKYSWMMRIVSFFQCKDILDQHWCMKSCSSSPRIIELVFKHVKDLWKEIVEDADSYRKFNNCRGQCSFQRRQPDQDLLKQEALKQSLEKPFDESVILWHIATDLCFYGTGGPRYHLCATAKCEGFSSDKCAIWCKRSEHHERAMGCIEMSNYMTYLLFVNPEMLIAGARRNIFTSAYEELKRMDISVKTPSTELNVFTAAYSKLMNVLKRVKPPLYETRRILADEVIKMESPQGPPKGYIQYACKLAEELLKIDEDDNGEMWKVIEGVWVEMLCFSASRCRGYLHAKALGTGGELLTYVWLLLSYMGMETLPERLQSVERVQVEKEVPSATS